MAATASTVAAWQLRLGHVVLRHLVYISFDLQFVRHFFTLLDSHSTL